MLELTTCPGCQAELAAPPTADSISADRAPARLECPLCGTHFALQSAKLRRVPAAKVPKPAVAPAPQVRAEVKREVAETVELPPLGQEPVKELELKSPLTKLADLLDTPPLRPFVAAAKAESPAPKSPAAPVAKPLAATIPEIKLPEIKLPEVKAFIQPPAQQSIAQTVDRFAPVNMPSDESEALLTRDFEFDLSTPDDSQGFNPFDAEPPEEATVEVATREDDPAELGWALSRRLRNAAIVTMFTSACALGFLAFRPGGSEPVAPNNLTTTAELPAESNLLASATDLLSPSDEPRDEPAPRTDPAVEPAAFAAEEPPAPITPIEGNPPLSGAPTYSAEDLVAALEGATEARNHLQSHTLDDAAEVAALGRNYARLCYLAQVYALLDDEAAADSLRDRLLARDQFSLLFESTRARSEVSKIAGPWIAWKNKPHGGVFFCGTLPEPIRHGELFEYPFELTPGQVLPVLLEEPVDNEQFGRAGSNVAAVIGVLVENPADRLPGYTGSAPQAVWCRELLPLREARLE